MASKEQKEGVARVFDTITATSIIAVTASIAGYGNIAKEDVILIIITIPFLFTLSWLLRRP